MASGRARAFHTNLKATSRHVVTGLLKGWVRCDFCAYWINNPNLLLHDPQWIYDPTSFGTPLCEWCWNFIIDDDNQWYVEALGSPAHWWSDRQCIARAIQYGQLLPMIVLDDNLIQYISGFLALNAGL